MNRFTLLLLVLLPPGHLSGQVMTGGIYSIRDSLPVPFANVALMGSSRGTYSNDKGTFSIGCEPGNSLSITVVGYARCICTCQEKMRIYLVESVDTLREVVIRHKSFHGKTTTIGFFNRKRSGGFDGANAVAIRLHNTGNLKGTVTKLRFQLTGRASQTLALDSVLVRLLLYAKSETHAPDDPLLPTDVRKHIDPHDSEVTFDIRAYNIPFPDNGAFVGIEFVGYYCEGKFTVFSSDDVNKRSFYHAAFSKSTTKSDSWVRRDYDSAWRPLAMGSVAYNFNFGLELEQDRKY